MPINAKKHRLSAAQIATIALLGSCLTLSQAFGQAQPPTNRAPNASPPTNGAPPAASPASISDQKLKAAAAAIPEVEGIRQNYQQQIAQAPQGDKARLQNQAGDEMKKAITDQGLSIPEYNSIVQTAEQNPQIRARLIQQMPDQGQPRDQGQGRDHAPGP
jgi:hypothetical protein